MPLLKTKSVPAVSIAGRVIGVWDYGDHRLVQILPGTNAGIAMGMQVEIVRIADGLHTTIGTAVITNVRERFAEFATDLPLDSVLADVVVSG
jgi:hypothetical protein